MASLNSPALRRRLDALTDAVRERVGHRQRMREYATAAASIRAALAAGIDPAQNHGMREFAPAERVAAQWPDTPELQRADAAFIAQDRKLAARRNLAVEAGERAARFIAQLPPDPGASPFDWYAWSLAARPAAPADPP